MKASLMDSVVAENGDIDVGVKCNCIADKTIRYILLQFNISAKTCIIVTIISF